MAMEERRRPCHYRFTVRRASRSEEQRINVALQNLIVRLVELETERHGPRNRVDLNGEESSHEPIEAHRPATDSQTHRS